MMNTQKISYTALIIALLSGFAVYFNNLEVAGIVLFLGTSYFVVCFFIKSFSDNRKTEISKIKWIKVILLTLLVWIPIAFLLMPGIYISFLIDDNIEKGVQWAYHKTEDKLETIEKEIETIKREPIVKRWYNPMDWIRGGSRYVERKVITRTQEEVVKPASHAIRVLFSFVFAFLRYTQFLFYISITYIFIRSFLFAFSRALLYGGTTIKFKLPHG